MAWGEIIGETTRTRRMTPQVVARNAEPFTMPFGLLLAPHAKLKDAEEPEIVIVTDLWMPPGDDPRGRWAEEAAWVRQCHERGALVCSICTGTIFLAEAGLLDGVEATTHWGATRFFAAYYPRVKLRPERILCAAGAEHRIVTSGGSGAWSDLALYLVARFCGQEEAIRIAKLFLLGDRSEGQLPFSAMGRTPAHADAAVARCQEWLADHYADPNPVTRMAALSGLPQRTFKRRFKAATGYTPIDYVQALRIEEAKHLLERSGEATETVADLVGYDDSAFFRRLFKRLTGVTPARYRQRYRYIGMALEDDTQPRHGR